MPNIIESHLSMADGTKIFIRDWLNEEIDANSTADHNNEPQPCIVILHGFGEHCGRYEHIAAFLNSRGFAVRTYDHRGHGQSDGARGDCPDSMSIVNDAEIIIRDFAQHCQHRPILFGHSMGGLFAARIALAADFHTINFPICGLVLSSPALALRLTRAQRLLIKTISVIAPHFATSPPFNPEVLSHQLATVVAYISDPLVHRKITASLGNSMLSAIDFVKTHASKLAVPTLLLVAEDDRIVDPQGSHAFFEALPDKLGTAHFYVDYYHEVFNEVGADKVFDDLNSWLTKFINEDNNGNK